MNIWTKTPPTEPGWYWHRFREDSKPSPVRVANEPGAVLLSYAKAYGGIWGPRIPSAEELAGLQGVAK